MRGIDAIRHDMEDAFSAADTEKLKALAQEAEPERLYESIKIRIERMRGFIDVTWRNLGRGWSEDTTVETGVVEAIRADAHLLEGRSFDNSEIASVLRELDRRGDSETLEELRNAVDLLPAKYAGTLSWCLPTVDDDGQLVWVKQTIKHNSSYSNGCPSVKNAAESVGRMMATSPELELAFKTHQAAGPVFLEDHDWGRAGRAGLRSLRTEDGDNALCERALATALEWRKRLADELPPPRPIDPITEELDDPYGLGGPWNELKEDASEWADVLMGAAVAGNRYWTARLAATGAGTVAVTGISRPCEPGDCALAELTTTRHTFNDYQSLMKEEKLTHWTTLTDALEVATDRLPAETGVALEAAMMADPDGVGAEVRRVIERGGPEARMKLETPSPDGVVPLIVPTAGDAPWSLARCRVERARRAIDSKPVITRMTPPELRSRWRNANAENGPPAILARMAGAVDWSRRYTVRRVFLALQPYPGEEAVIEGPPRLTAHAGTGDGRITLRLESPAWEAHGVDVPTGEATVADALIMAGQTNCRLDRAPIQDAVTRLVWSDDVDEVDKVAACLTCTPELVDDGQDGPIDFGRFVDRETVRLYTA